MRTGLHGKCTNANCLFQGLSFIHGSDLNHHGRLRSSNCVVDNRFVLKLMDFGLRTFYGSDEDESEHRYYSSE